MTDRTIGFSSFPLISRIIIVIRTGDGLDVGLVVGDVREILEPMEGGLSIPAGLSPGVLKGIVRLKGRLVPVLETEILAARQHHDHE